MDFWCLRSEIAGTKNASELENSTFYKKIASQIYKNTWETTSVTFCLSKVFPQG